MMEALPSLVVGGLVAVLGAGLMFSHRQNFARRRYEGELEEYEHQYHTRQYRRRMQTSGLLAAIGVLIIVGDAFIDWRRSPYLFTIYWGIVLCLALWVILLGMGDWFSLRTHGRVLKAHEERMHDLHRQLLARDATGGNGKNVVANDASTSPRSPDDQNSTDDASSP